MKKLFLALAPALFLFLASPAHAAAKSLSGCIREVGLSVRPEAGLPRVVIGDQRIIFAKDKIYLHPTRAPVTFFSTPEDWVRWEKMWDLLMRGADAKVEVAISYSDTTNEVRQIWVLFKRPCG